MRKLIWIMVLAALAWSAWWFIGAAALRRGIDAAVDEMRASGWQVAIEDRRVRGFPNRFDTTLVAPSLTETGSDITWSAPFVQVLALSYRPNRVIVAFPDEQRVEGPFGTARIATERARGSVTLAPEPSLALDHSEFVVDDLAIESGARLSLDELLFATRRPPGDASGRTHNIGITISGLDLPETVAAALGGDAGRIGYANLDATASFARPIDRTVLSEGMPRPQAIAVDRLDVNWGEIGLSGSGALEIGADGRLTGVLDLELENWRRALDLLARIGVVPPEQLSIMTRGLGFMTGLSDDPETLSAPLAFRDGRMFLGPVPLGPAPRLPL